MLATSDGEYRCRACVFALGMTAYILLAVYGRYLRQMLDHLGGVPEYALAAYNAGENRVTDWQSAGPYQGMDEFVESIPFTETHDYVQSVLRNAELYRKIYGDRLR